jgi:hypothetical protein
MRVREKLTDGRRVPAKIAVALMGFVASVGLGAGLLSGTGCGEDCLYHGQNCSQSYLEKNHKVGWECCADDDTQCCVTPLSNGVQVCAYAYECD